MLLKLNISNNMVIDDNGRVVGVIEDTTKTHINHISELVDLGVVESMSFGESLKDLLEMVNERLENEEYDKMTLSELKKDYYKNA